MVEQRIIDYIKKYQQDFPLEEIKRKLVASGMSQADVDEAAKQAGAAGEPSAVSQLKPVSVEQQQAQQAQAEQAQAEEATAGKGEGEKKGGFPRWLMIVIPLAVLIILGGIYTWLLLG